MVHSTLLTDQSSLPRGVRERMCMHMRISNAVPVPSQVHTHKFMLSVLSESALVFSRPTAQTRPAPAASASVLKA